VTEEAELVVSTSNSLGFEKFKSGGVECFGVGSGLAFCGHATVANKAVEDLVVLGDSPGFSGIESLNRPGWVFR